VRVLVVEDDPTLAAVVAIMLSEDGHDVVSVADRRAALALLPGGTWDVCLSDGFDAVATGPSERDLAELAALQAVAPVVVFTAHAWAAHQGPERFGVSALLPKPFDLADLVDTLHAVTRRA
jgi:CheY-like chemotaxis protein